MNKAVEDFSQLLQISSSGQISSSHSESLLLETANFQEQHLPLVEEFHAIINL